MRRMIQATTVMLGCLLGAGAASAAQADAAGQVNGHVVPAAGTGLSANVAWAQVAPYRSGPAYWRSWQARPYPDRFDDRRASPPSPAWQGYWQGWRDHRRYALGNRSGDAWRRPPHGYRDWSRRSYPPRRSQDAGHLAYRSW